MIDHCAFESLLVFGTNLDISSISLVHGFYFGCVLYFFTGVPFVFGMRISTDTLIAAVCDTSDRVITKHFSQTTALQRATYKGSTRSNKKVPKTFSQKSGCFQLSPDCSSLKLKSKCASILNWKVVFDLKNETLPQTGTFSILLLKRKQPRFELWDTAVTLNPWICVVFTLCICGKFPFWICELFARSFYLLCCGSR